MLRLIAYIALATTLSACTKKTSSEEKIMFPDNDRYLNAGFGKKNSYYTDRNLQTIDDISSNPANITLSKRQEIENSREKIESSRFINQYITGERTKQYIDNYKNIANTNHQPNSLASPKADKVDYFDLKLYNKTIPQKNINKVKQMRTENLIPLTPEYQELFDKFYQQYGYYPEYFYTERYKLRKQNKGPVWLDYHNSPHRYEIVRDPYLKKNNRRR